MAYINVHVDDYFDVDIDIDEYLQEARTRSLEEELARRTDSVFYRYPINGMQDVIKAAQDQVEDNALKTKNFLCDILRLPHTVSDKELLEEIEFRL